MSQLDDLLAIEFAPKPKKCKVCTWYDKLPPDIKGTFDKTADSDAEVKPFYRACTRLPEDPLMCEVTTFRNHLRTCLR